MYFCSICWRPWDQCTCVEIEATRMCSTCHTEIVGGLCNCYCPYCFHLLDECICNSGNTGSGGGNSGSSGGSSGGGGSGGGGNSGSGNSTPSFSELPTSERVAKLTSSASKAVQAVLNFDNEPGNPNKDKPINERSMMCNYSVGKFYEEIYGEIPDYLKGSVYSPTRYDYKFANDWYNLLAQHTEDWTEIVGSANNDSNLAAWLTAVQAKADDGYFVVCVAQGIIKNGSMGPGHIVVVIPSPDGNLFSNNWTVDTPHTIDCGKGRRSDDTDLSAGFTNQSKWKDKIKFYYHK